MQLRIAGLFLICALAAFAQGDRGTITGTVTDPTGAVVPNASIQITNSDTSAVYKVATTNTGNYTLANLPVGTYVLTVDAPGFKKFERPGLVVQVAETERIDAVLTVGASTDTVTVNAEAPLLKTESGEISHQVDYSDADLLPLFTTNGSGGSTGMGNIRDPLTVLNSLPGAQQNTDSILRINGLPSSSQTIMVEGMDATNGLWRQLNQSTQQGTDAVQEVSVQTSNYAAEYGGAGGGYLNFTMKSGTNQYHGSAYEYFVNSALNAGLPFSANCNEENNCATNPNSGLIKNVVKRNDYGFTLGGPIKIPKLYNGKDRTFFFFNFEQFRQSTVTNNGVATVPIPAYTTGNFSAAEAPYLAGINSDGAIPNLLYDPGTRHTVNGVPVESPFANNTIPISRLDPVALYLQSFFPKANVPGALINNYEIPAYSNFQHTTIPSMKIDQILNSKMKLSGYISVTETNSPNSNGFATDLAPAVPDADRSYTYRLNFDDTITPTLLFHFGAGLLYYYHPDLGPQVSSFTPGAVAAAAQGFGGAPGGHTFAPFPASTYMPNFAGLNDAFVGGGIALGSGFFAPSPGTSGLAGGYEDKDIKPTANTSVTWVHGNHTFKAGADMVLEGFPQQSSLRAFGEYGFSANQTENPAEYGVPGVIFPSGFPYASFLLGQTSYIETSAVNDSRLGNHTWGAFIQDSWKVSRRLTLELGLRWDYATLLQEEHGRMSDADFQGVNPALASPEYPGGRAGSIIYGATNDGKPLSNAYPFSLGPHLGIAYQITPKTVFRAGGSIAYSSSPDNAFLSASVANFYTLASPGQFLPATQLSNGNPLTGALAPTFPEYNQYPFPISSSGCGEKLNLPCVPPQEPFISIQKSSGRLPRIFQWSIGFQQELAPNLIAEASYVGNRGAWFTAPLLDTEAFNGLTQNILSNLTTEGPGGKGLYGTTSNMAFTNPADYALLNTPISNPAVQARFPALVNPSNVYPGFPSSETLAQALRPYPQWFGVPPFLGPPMGDTWYDSLQIKVTKRYSHGLTGTVAYTWSKSLTNAANSNTSYLTPNDPVLNDPYNTPTIKQLSGFDQPQVLVMSFSYTTPKVQTFGESAAGKTANWLARDWTIGGVLKYASGQLIQSSPSDITLWNTMGIGGTPLNGVSNFGGNEPLANYVPGQNCLAVNPNSHFDPTKTLALNPNAWSQQTTETFGDSAPYYNDCRWQRQPAESLSLGRIFRIKEKVQLLIQAQFFNPFNRVFYPTPAVAGPTNVNSASAPTYGAAFPGSPAPPFGVNGALNGGFGYVNVVNGGTAEYGIGPNPRSGQLVARFTF